MKDADAIQSRASEDWILWLFVLVLTGSLSLNVWLGLQVLGTRRQIALLNPPHAIEATLGGSLFDLDLNTPDGKQTKISMASRSRPLVLYIFSPTCKWCDLNLVQIRDLAETENRKFDFIGISTTGLGLEQYLKNSS